MITVNFLETIAGCDLKAGRGRQLIGLMKIYIIEGQGHFLPCPKVIYIRKLNLAFLRNHWTIFNQILYASLHVKGVENFFNMIMMTKMAAMPIYGKNPSKIFLARTSGPNFTKLGT